MWYIETGESNVEKIKCPECDCIQDAIVEHTLPFATYVHHCENCGHIIMESEWIKINQ